MWHTFPPVCSFQFDAFHLSLTFGYLSLATEPQNGEAPCVLKHSDAHLPSMYVQPTSSTSNICPEDRWLLRQCADELSLRPVHLSSHHRQFNMARRYPGAFRIMGTFR